MILHARKCNRTLSLLRMKFYLIAFGLLITAVSSLPQGTAGSNNNGRAFFEILAKGIQAALSTLPQAKTTTTSSLPSLANPFQSSRQVMTASAGAGTGAGTAAGPGAVIEDTAAAPIARAPQVQPAIVPVPRGRRAPDPAVIAAGNAKWNSVMQEASAMTSQFSTSPFPQPGTGVGSAPESEASGDASESVE
jgi:hypothetical protein